MSSTRRPTVEPALAAASRAVFVTFALNGLNFASWAARIPAVRDELSLSAAAVGVLLLIGAIGSLVALPVSGLVVQRLGAPRTVAVFATANVAGLLVAAAGVSAGQVVLVGVGLVLFGVGTGIWDAAMNLEGVFVEQRLGRTVMPRYHAGFSVGTIVGAGLGALAAAVHASVLVHLLVVLSLSLVGVLWAVRAFLPDGHTDDVSAVPGSHDPGVPASHAAAYETHAPAPAGTTADEPGTTTGARPGGGARRAFGAWLEPRTLLIGVITLAAALTEGAANDWVALAVVDGFDQTNAVGALTFALFVTAMTAMRLGGTHLLDRYGRIAVLRLCGALSIVGLLIFGLVPWLPLALVGVVLWGLGAALGFPVGMSAASDDPVRAPARVSVVATIGYSAFLAGPPLLGLLAEVVGYRHALLAIAVPVVVALFVVRAAEPLTPVAVSTADDAAPVTPRPEPADHPA